MFSLRRISFFSMLLAIGSSSLQAKIIHITPGAFGNIFDTQVKIGNGQISCYRLREALQKRGYTLQQGESFSHLHNPEYIIFFDLSGSLEQLKKYPKEKRILFLWEPPSSEGSPRYSQELHQMFGKVFTWHDTLVDNATYFKFHYPQPTLDMISPLVPFNEKKLCSLFVCNKNRPHPNQLYSERKSAIDFFEKLNTNEFDLYGIGWEKEKYKNYKGYIFDKIGCLSHYKFNICYENTKNLPGYVTEKIFDCLVAGSVPIYLGANNITDYVPKNCFIDRRDFSSFNELYIYISSMPQNTYNQYIKNIQTYLKSDRAWHFSSDAFIANFINVLGLK